MAKKEKPTKNPMVAEILFQVKKVIKQENFSEKIRKVQKVSKKTYQTQQRIKKYSEGRKANWEKISCSSIT